MKKVLCLVLLFCLFTVSLFAETVMEVVESTDDFGEPTGDSYFVIMTDDFTFSNSATIGIGRNGSIAMIAIYSNDVIACLAQTYSTGGIETFIDDKISISYKAGDNKPVSFTLNSTKLGTFVSLDVGYNGGIIKAMKENNKIQFVVKGTKYEATTKLNFTFEYDKDELNKKLKEIGK